MINNTHPNLGNSCSTRGKKHVGEELKTRPRDVWKEGRVWGQRAGRGAPAAGGSGVLCFEEEVAFPVDGEDVPD